MSFCIYFLLASDLIFARAQSIVKIFTFFSIILYTPKVKHLLSKQRGFSPLIQKKALSLPHSIYLIYFLKNYISPMMRILRLPLSSLHSNYQQFIQWLTFILCKIVHFLNATDWHIILFANVPEAIPLLYYINCHTWQILDFFLI